MNFSQHICKFIFAFFCCIGWASLSAQDNLPFPIDGKWIFNSGSFSAWGGTSSDPIALAVQDTVTVGENVYWKLASTDVCPLQDGLQNEILLREDSGKWIVLIEDSIEFLYCDFNLGVGDTILQKHPWFDDDSQEYSVVTQIETIFFMDGVERKKYTLHYISFPETETCCDFFWIEGIGSSVYFDFVTPPGWFDSGWFDLTCFAEGAGDSFPVTSFGECCWVGQVENESAQFSLHPNPTFDSFVIQSDQPIVSCQIFDVYGSQVHSAYHPVIDGGINIAHLAAGIYLVQIVFQDGRWVCERLVRG